MIILRFIFSFEFLKQLIKAAIFFTLITVLSLKVLNIVTYHNQHQVVPDVLGLELNKAIKILDENSLRYEVIDSAKFNAKLPPFAIIELIPGPGNEVKKDRKIYLTLNPSGYRKISVPNIIQITFRNAESMLKAVGFEIGKISFRNNIGKNMVLEIRYRGKKIAPGSVFPKTTKIDLVLGNGKRPGSSSTIETQ